MKNTHPKKFALIGLPGSGKSTFASKLGEILNIPVHHLDRHMFEPGGKKRDKQELIETQKSFKTLAPSLDLDKSKKQQPPQRSYSV